MLIGRSGEQANLREAILARRSILVCGPADSGKTALLEETLATLPSKVRENCLVCKAHGPPRQIWQSLAHRLAELHDGEVISRMQRETGSSTSFDRWLHGQTSLRLRGILRRAMRSHSYWVFLEAATRLPEGVYRLLQEWVWSRRTPVILLARGSTEREVGKAARLFWHKGLQLHLGPIRTEDLEILLENAAERFGISKFADAEFRDFALKQSAGLPGKMLRLCELASQSAYQFGGRVKLHTLAVDFLLQEKQASCAIARTTHHG